MGQRTQIIIKNSVFYNENNPNNREPHFIVYHNQWLYGMNFLKWGERFIKAIESQKSQSMYDKDIVDQRNIDDAVMYANYADLNYFTNSRLADKEFEKDYLYYNKLFKKVNPLTYFDNNNGFMYIELINGKIKLQLYNGTEQDDAIGIKTPLEYLHLFYKTNELIEGGEIKIFDTIAYLDNYYNRETRIGL